MRGFRGIGEAAAIDLVPGPGLTVVVGRNGSGKSSFAEAAELALTGDNLRWADRTQDWKDGWRNLHVDGDRYVRVGLAIEGRAGDATVECRWAEGAALADRQSFLQVAGERRESTADLDWEQPLALYRPFLSYSELGRIIGGRPKDMYDSLHSVLGLDRLVEIEDQLKGARRPGTGAGFLLAGPGTMPGRGDDAQPASRLALLRRRPGCQARPYHLVWAVPGGAPPLL